MIKSKRNKNLSRLLIVLGCFLMGSLFLQSAPSSITTQSYESEIHEDENQKEQPKTPLASQTATLTYLTTWVGGWSQPLSLEYVNGSIYMVDGYGTSNYIRKFTVDGTLITSWGTGSWSRRLEWDGSSYFYFSYTTSARKYDLNGNIQFNFGSFNADSGGIALSGSNIFISASQDNVIKKYDMSGTFIQNFGASGSGNGQFSSPQEITYGNNELFICDNGNNRIQVLDTNGNFIRQWATPSPCHIDYHDGLIFVDEYTTTPYLYIFDIYGNLLYRYGTGVQSDSPGGLNYPQDLDVGTDHILYVMDGGGHIDKFAITFNQGLSDQINLSIPSEFTQPPQQVWNHTWGGTLGDYFQDVYKYNSTIYVAGYTSSFSSGGNFSAILLAYDESGMLLWNTTLLGIKSMYSKIIIENNMIYCCGDGYIGSNHQSMVSKYYLNGTLIWNRVYVIGVRFAYNRPYTAYGFENKIILGGCNHIDALLFEIDSDGNVLWTSFHNSVGGVRENFIGHIWTNGSAIYTIGGHEPDLGGINNVWLAKWSMNGSLLLDKVYKYSDLYDRAWMLSSDGNALYVVGVVNGGASNGNVLIGKYSFDGTEIWTRTWNSGGDEGHQSAGMIISGDLLIFNIYCNGMGAGGNDLTLLAYDKAGNYLWNQTYGGASDDTANSIWVEYNVIYLVGSTSSFGAGSVDGIVMKLVPKFSLLKYSTFLGGSSDDQGPCMTIDSGGNIYFASRTESTNLPTTANCLDATPSEYGDIYFGKFNPTTSTLLYATYLGGNNMDWPMSIELDNNGNVILIGQTCSTDYPTTVGAYQTTAPGGTWDIFITKLNSTYNGLVFSTYIGGYAIDRSYGLTVSSDNSIYITGDTNSDNFPYTAGVYDSTYSSNSYIYISHLAADGSLLQSTFLGDSGGLMGLDLEMAPNGDLMCLMVVYSEFGTTAGAWDTTYNSYNDNILVRMDSTLTNLLYSSYIGGSNDESLTDLYFDENGYVYISGYTLSSNFPTTTNAIDRIFGGTYEGVLMKFNPDNSLNFSTYLGGGGNDIVAAILKVDSAGKIFVMGTTGSTDFLTTVDAYNRTYSGGTTDLFYVIINSTGTGLIYSTFIGGSGAETAGDLKATLKPSYQADNMMYFMMDSTSANFPMTAGTYDDTHNGNKDLVIIKLKDQFDITNLSPVLSSPADQSWVVGTTGHSISWTPADLTMVFPCKYSVWIGSTCMAVGTWNHNNSIIYSIDGLSSGIYSIELQINDGFIGGNASDTVSVNVTDNSPLVEYEYISGWIGASNQIFDVEYINGYIYVIGGYSGWSIIKYYPNGTYITHWVVGDWCRKLEWDFGDYFYYSSTSFARKYNISDVAQFNFGSFSADLGGIAISPTNVFISASQENTIKKYDTNGNYITNIGSSGSGNGQLNNPQEITYGNGELFVADNSNNRVQVFSSEGIYLRQWASPNPFCISYHDGYVIVAEYSENKSIFIYDINGNLFNTIELGFNYPRDIDISPDHILYVVDTLGLRVEKYQLTFNEISLSIPNITAPSDQSFIQDSVGKNITWTVVDSISGITTYAIWQDSTCVQIGTWTSGFPISYRLEGLTPGSYTYEIQVNDGLGANVSDTVLVTVNANVLPSLTIPADQSWNIGTTGHNVSWTVTDTTTQTPLKYSIWQGAICVQIGTWSTNDVISYPLDGLAVNTYSFELQVNDGIVGGNSSDQISVTVQNLVPALTSPDDQTWVFGTSGHSLGWIVTDSSTQSPRLYSLWNGSTCIQTGTWVDDDVISYVIDGLAQGSHVFELQVNDGYLGGNASDSVSITVGTNTPPTLTSPVDQSWNIGTTGHSISWTVTDLSTEFPRSYSIWNGSTCIQIGEWKTDDIITCTIDGLAIGPYFFELQVYDGIVSGNNSDQVSITVLNVVPSLDAPGDQTWEVGTTGHFISWTATDASTQIPRVFSIWQGATCIATGNWMTGSAITHTINGLPQGSYVFEIQVNDGFVGGNASDSVSVTVNANTVPSLTAPADQNRVFGSTGYFISWTATDASNGTTVYTIYRNGTEVSSNSWISTISFSISLDNLDVGIYNYTCIVSDGIGGIAQDEVIITITNILPTLSTPADVVYTVGTVGHNLIWTPTDLSTHDPRAYSIWRGVLCLATGSWTSETEIIFSADGFSQGTWVIEIQINDGYIGGNASDSVMITVTSNSAPSVSTPADQTWLVGTVGNMINWTINDGEMGTTNYAVYQNGLIVRSGSWTNGNTISMNLSGLDPGMYNYTIIVNDGLPLGQSSDSAWIIVWNHAPEVTQPLDQSWAMNTTGHSISWVPTDVDFGINVWFNITQNGVLVVQNAVWSNGVAITRGLDSLLPGTYIITITLCDGYSFNATVSDTIQITVSNTNPTLSSPADLSYGNGTLGHHLNWTVSDVNTMNANYQILSDGVVKANGSWISDSVISFSVDGLSIGIHNITIVANDGYNGIATDLVWITVYDLPPILYIQQPTNGSLFTSINNLGLQYYVENIAIQTVWYKVNSTDQWVVILGNTTFNVLYPGYHSLIVIVQSSSGQNYTSMPAVFRIVIDNNSNASIEIAMQVISGSFQAGQTMEVQITITNKGTVDLTNVNFYLERVTTQYQLDATTTNNYTFPLIATSQAKVFTIRLIVTQTVDQILIRGHFTADTYHQEFAYPLIPGTTTSPLVYVFTVAGVATVGGGYYGLKKKKGFGSKSVPHGLPDKHADKHEPSLDKNDEVEFQF